VTRLVAYAGEAITALWRNRTRSILTTIGMIIGSSSIIAVFGISKGATSGIAATVNSFGPSPIVIFVDRTQDYPQIAQIRYRDVARVQNELGSEAAEVAPFYQQAMAIKSGSKVRFYQVAGQGISQQPAIEFGRPTTQEDVREGARVAFLTDDVSRYFFGDSDPVGRDITIAGTHFTIAGVYAPAQGTLFSGSVNQTVGIPYTAYYRAFPGDPGGLAVYPADESHAAQVADDAKKALQHIHGRHAQYDVQDAQKLVEGFEKVLNIAGVGLSAIGAVALVVAGIGIMNIMLVSVTERTREIGIRKSVGASAGDIALQFLMEAVLLALAGGATGMAIGLAITIGGAELLSKQVGAVVIPYVLVVAIALSFSGAVGLLSGLWPALRAARMDPIEALRS
jgi:putative ABC transport system permease protein